MILTQSCDVVRRHQERPFVAVAPLVEVGVEDLQLIEGGYRPQYAWIPGVADRNLVADLDRIMTVNKSTVAKWKRVQGCASDEEARAFAKAIARKSSRFAFPDDFTPVVKKLQERLREKHGKASPEGEALRNVKEIRVRAAPSWDAESVELMFWFICYDGVKAAQIRKDSHLERWLALLQAGGRYKSPPLGAIVTLEDLTGKDYIESDPLDLDHLSGP